MGVRPDTYSPPPRALPQGYVPALPGRALRDSLTPSPLDAGVIAVHPPHERDGGSAYHAVPVPTFPFYLHRVPPPGAGVTPDSVTDGVAVPVWDGLGLAVAVEVWVRVAVPVCVSGAVADGVAVAENVAVALRVSDPEHENVAVSVRLRLAVGVKVYVWEALSDWV